MPRCAQVIINNNALPCLLALLTNNHKKSIKKEACWTISNITAATRSRSRQAAHHTFPAPRLDRPALALQLATRDKVEASTLACFFCSVLCCTGSL